jgi:hypothetical protein
MNKFNKEEKLSAIREVETGEGVAEGSSTQSDSLDS